MSDIASILTGNDPYPISQGYAVNSPDVPDWWYEYAVDGGLEYGQHPGLDIATPNGTPLFSVSSGTVIEATDAPEVSPFFRPNPVRVKADNGDELIYGHMWTNVVEPGDRVTIGQYLGESGEQTYKGTRTPDGSGPHVHFEVRDSLGQFLDPVAYLQGKTGDPGPIKEPGDSGGGGGIGGRLGSIVSRAGVAVAGLAVFSVGILMLANMAKGSSQ